MKECFRQRFILSSEPILSLKILTFVLLIKLVAISLLTVFLGANTELHQLLRLPVLIHHFFEHHDQEPDESFADFLNEHYSDNQNHSDTNHNDHENLPFKTNDCATAHVSIAFVNPTSFSISRPKTFQDKVSPIYNGLFYSSSVVGSIWQPPKIS
jgi:hypothetical protein